MRHALRRVLWSVPILFLISLFAFWVLTAGAGLDVSRAASSESEHPLLGHHSLPRFFNSNPLSARDLSLRAMSSVASDDATSGAARRELVRLGGAALPHVLPQLDSLEPRGRARVALALAPIAKRMSVGTSEELENPEAAVLFWTRFWADRAIEFRPVVVKRAVARLSEKSTAGRREDVRQLDTFALPELLSRLPPIESPEDVKRARRITVVASAIAGRPWVVPKNASLPAARSVVSQWQVWWLEHRADYVVFDGAERSLAMVSETQYGRWAAEAAQNRWGLTRTGRPVLDLMLARAPVTLWLLASGMLGGWLVGVALGMVGAARAHEPSDYLTAAVAVLVAALPVGLGLVWLPPASAVTEYFAGGTTMVGVAAVIVSRHQRTATRVALDQEYTRTARAFGAGPWRLARWSVRSSSVAAVSLLGVHLTTLLTVAFVLEHALGLQGLGSTTLLAVTTRDVAWLMALSLVVAALLALAQIVSDALLAALDPRVGVALGRKRGVLL